MSRSDTTALLSSVTERGYRPDTNVTGPGRHDATSPAKAAGWATRAAARSSAKDSRRRSASSQAIGHEARVHREPERELLQWNQPPLA